MQKYYITTLKAWKILKPFHKRFYIHMGLIFLFSFLSVYMTTVQGKIFTSIANKDLTHFAIVVLALMGLALFLTFINFLKNYNEETYLSQDVIQHLQYISFSKILSLTPEQHIEDHSSIKQQIISRGESSIETIIKTYLSQILPNATYLFSALCALFYYNIILGITTFIFLSILAIWVNYFLKFYKPLIQKNRDNWTEQGKIKTEAFTHLFLVKILGRESYFIKKYIERRKTFADFSIHISRIRIFHNSKKDLFSDVYENSLLFLVGVLAFFGNLTIATVYVVWSITARAFWSISGISEAIKTLPLRYVEADQYFEAIEKEPSFKEKGLRNVNLSGEIIFNNVSFKYHKGTTNVFENLSCVIPYSKITAFVGASGSGKSTIMKLLVRSYQYNQGTITINGTDLTLIDAHYLRESIGYVEQHVDLLDDTIKENILLGVKEYSHKLAENRLEDVAKLARIDQFYHRLGEEKFDTVVGERGIKLSGGERQRIGIARAIIKDPEILIFDEATSSLDTENEKYVMDAINDVSKGKTTIIIAHRLSTVRNADKIIVMDKGRVVGEGTHDELMENNEVYQNLVAHQIS